MLLSYSTKTDSMSSAHEAQVRRPKKECETTCVLSFNPYRLVNDHDTGVDHTNIFKNTHTTLYYTIYVDNDIRMLFTP